MTRPSSLTSWPASASLGNEDVPVPGRTWSWPIRRTLHARSASTKRGIRAVIPVPADQRGHRLRRGSQGGRPPAFDREAYKQRNTVERCINRLKQWRGLATRYEKTATIYLAGLYVAGIFLWSARPTAQEQE